MLLNLNPALTGVIDGICHADQSKNAVASVTKPFLTFSGSSLTHRLQNNQRRELIGLGLLINVDRVGDSYYTTFQPLFEYGFVKVYGDEIVTNFLSGILRIQQRMLNYDALTFDEQYQHMPYSADNPITENFPKVKFSFSIGD